MLQGPNKNIPHKFYFNQFEVSECVSVAIPYICYAAIVYMYKV